MRTIPELLEQDSRALKADPVYCLTRNVVKTDELLFAGELGKVAMTCGTTSTVVYMAGNEVRTSNTPHRLSGPLPILLRRNSPALQPVSCPTRPGQLSPSLKPRRKAVLLLYLEPPHHTSLLCRL